MIVRHNTGPPLAGLGSQNSGRDSDPGLTIQCQLKTQSVPRERELHRTTDRLEAPGAVPLKAEEPTSAAT